MHPDGYVGVSWHLEDFVDYIWREAPDVISGLNLRQTQGELWLLVKGDGIPVGGETWCHLSVTFANLGPLARTLSYTWTIALARCPEKETEALRHLWQHNLSAIQAIIDGHALHTPGGAMPCRVFFGGDLPWHKRWFGISVIWAVASLFTYAVWVGGVVRNHTIHRTVDRHTILQGLIARGALGVVEGAGCTGVPLSVVRFPYRHVIPCILHCLMAIGRLLLTFLRRQVKSLPVAQQNRIISLVAKETGVSMAGKRVSPDGEETWRLFRVWRQVAPLLGHGPGTRVYDAVWDMGKMLANLYQTMYVPAVLNCPLVATVFRDVVCPNSKSPYLFWLMGDVLYTLQSIQPFGLAMFAGDILESSNGFVKTVWEHGSNRGGGRAPGDSLDHMVDTITQVLQRQFLYFEAPRWRGSPRTALCNAQKESDTFREWVAGLG